MSQTPAAPQPQLTPLLSPVSFQTSLPGSPVSGWNPKSGVGKVRASRLVQSSLGPDCLERRFSSLYPLAQGPAGNSLLSFLLLESSWSLVCSAVSTAVAAAANAAGSSPKTKKLWAWAVLPAVSLLTW